MEIKKNPALETVFMKLNKVSMIYKAKILIIFRQYLSKITTVDALDNFRALMTNVFLVKFLAFSRTHALVSILSRLDCM